MSYNLFILEVNGAAYTPEESKRHWLYEEYKFYELENLRIDEGGSKYLVSVSTSRLPADQIQCDFSFDPSLPETLANVFKDILKYKDISKQLETIKYYLGKVSYDERHELEYWGYKAIEVIESAEPSRYFEDKFFSVRKLRSLEELVHTIHKEVSLAQSSFKKSASIKYRSGFLKDAYSHLINDIDGFLIHVKNFQIKEEYKSI